MKAGMLVHSCWGIAQSLSFILILVQQFSYGRVGWFSSITSGRARSDLLRAASSQRGHLLHMQEQDEQGGASVTA